MGNLWLDKTQIYFGVPPYSSNNTVTFSANIFSIKAMVTNVFMMLKVKASDLIKVHSAIHKQQDSISLVLMLLTQNSLQMKTILLVHCRITMI